MTPPAFRSLRRGFSLIAIAWLAPFAQSTALADDTPTAWIFAERPLELCDSWGNGQVFPKKYAPKFAREALRQAVIISAIEDGGFSAHDEVFFETASDQALPLTFEISLRHSLFSARVSMQGMALAEYEQTKPSLDNSNTLLIHDFSALAQEHITPQLQSLSPLKPTKFHPDPNNEPVPQSTLDRLNQLDFTNQFLMVQEAHALIDAHGPTPECLELLVKGYGHLSQHCRWQMRSHWATFGARALIYAQRMMNQWPDNPQSHWAMFHACVTNDLQNSAAEVRQNAIQRFDSKTLAQPTWVPIAMAAIMGDRKTLEDKAFSNNPDQNFACMQLLNFDELNANDPQLRSTAVTLHTMHPSVPRFVYSLAHASDRNMRQVAVEVENDEQPQLI